MWPISHTPWETTLCELSVDPCICCLHSNCFHADVIPNEVDSPQGCLQEYVIIMCFLLSPKRLGLMCPQVQGKTTHIHVHKHITNTLSLMSQMGFQEDKK